MAIREGGQMIHELEHVDAPGRQKVASHESSTGTSRPTSACTPCRSANSSDIVRGHPKTLRLSAPWIVRHRGPWAREAAPLAPARHATEPGRPTFGAPRRRGARRPRTGDAHATARLWRTPHVDSAAFRATGGGKARNDQARVRL